jgi:hypothetical protein
MSIDLEFLKRACPKGFFPVRGTLTRGGWTVLCVEPEDKEQVGGVIFVAPHREDSGRPVNALALAAVHQGYLLPDPFKCEDPEDQALGLALRLAHECGDLLPNVDPTDHATWACLLQSLAETAWSGPAMGPYINVAWEKGPNHWVLSAEGCSSGFRGIETSDPAEALVRAFIQLREKGAER